MFPFRAGLLALVLFPALAAAEPFTIRPLAFPATDLVWDPVSQRIYAGASGLAGPGIGNALSTIDPYKGVVERSVYLGSEPGRLAVSDNGQYVYALLNGAAAVRRYDIPNQAADLRFSLRRGDFGLQFGEDIAVAPGNPERVAVSLRFEGVSPRHAGVAIYDGGVLLPMMTPRHTGSNVIEFSNDPSRLYGYNNETTDFGLRRMNVDETGVRVADATGGLFSGFGVDIEYDRGVGLLFSTNGRVVDPETRTVLGSFAGIGFGSVVEPASDLGIVFFLTGNVLREYDLNTLALLSTQTIPGVSGSTDSLIRWGADGLAFRTASGQVFLLSRSGAAAASPNPEPSSWLLAGLGLGAVLMYSRSRRRAGRSLATRHS